MHRLSWPKNRENKCKTTFSWPPEHSSPCLSRKIEHTPISTSKTAQKLLKDILTPIWAVPYAGVAIVNGQKPTLCGERRFRCARSAPKNAPCRRAVRHRLSYPTASRPAEYRRRTHAGGPAGSDEATHHAGRAGPAADRESITRASWPTRSELSGGPASVARYPPG
jgi:hypothetical protein